MKKALAMLGILAMRAGCAGKPPPKIEIPTNVILIQGKLGAAPDVNPDPSGQPSPVLVRVYELVSDDVFNRTDFFTLFDHESAVLGGALLRVRNFPLVPGQLVDITGQADPNTQFIGVIAAVRDLDAARWRATAPLPPKTVQPSLPHQVTAQIGIARAGVQLMLGGAPVPEIPTAAPHVQ